MESTTEQSSKLLEKLTRASLTPKRLSPRNTHFSPTKYCLNKPKLFKQFRKSSLFHNSNSLVNLHPYSQRYTYNERINSFEKQDPNSTVKPFDIERIISNSPQKHEKVQKMSKHHMLKKKIPKIASQNSQFSSSFGQRINIKRTFSKKLSLNNYLIRQKLQQSASRVFSIENKDKKQLKTSKRKFIDGFPSKSDKKVLMQYINKNPINFSPKHPHKENQESKQQENFLKTNKSFRKFRDSVSPGQKLNLGGQKLKQLREQDQKYERQKIRLRQQLFYLIDEEIKKLYDLVSQLKGLGYSEQKVSEWIWIFCQNNKKFLQQIIFKPQNCRNSIIQTKVVYRMEDIEQTKINAKKYKRVINNIPIDIQIEDITELTSYLEEIFISKQYFELKRLQNKIQDTRYAIKNNYLDMKNEKVGEILQYVNNFQENKKFKPLEYYEMLSFYEDAKRIESHFGKVKGLTSGNKKKFENLSDVEFEIQRKKKEIQN